MLRSEKYPTLEFGGNDNNSSNNSSGKASVSSSPATSASAASAAAAAAAAAAVNNNASLSSANKNKIVVLEDMPNVATGRERSFHDILRCVMEEVNALHTLVVCCKQRNAPLLLFLF